MTVSIFPGLELVQARNTITDERTNRITICNTHYSITQTYAVARKNRISKATSFPIYSNALKASILNKKLFF